MRRIVWLGVVMALAGVAVGCAAADDEPLFEAGGAAGSAGASGAISASGGAGTGGTVNTGGAATGGAASGGQASGGQASGGPSTSGGSISGGAPTGGVSAGGSTGGSGGATIGPGGAGGSSGGRSGFGGRNSGGRSGTGGTIPGTGGMPGAPAECALTLDGATGDEPDGKIPVCCTPSVAEKTLIEQVFTLLNEHRMANGESALAYDTELEAAIQGHCVHMSQHSFFAHEAEETGVVTPWDRAKLCGTSANGENIAQGQRNPAAVMDAWTDSSGHNENMLSSKFTRVGIGYAADGRYWGQIFGQ